MSASTSDSCDENTVVCCVCGVSIKSNPSYRCMPCLRNEYDISSDVPKEVTIYFCRGCDRYLEPPAQWITATLESKELLSLCLKKLHGLDKLHLVDATFLFTEAHSKRLKLKVVVQKEVDTGAVLQQSFEVEFVIGHQFCGDCHRIEAKDFWKASLQVRQKVTHKRTFFYLEQLMLKHNIARLTSSITAAPGGLDLFFHSERDAKKVAEFISSSVICKSGTSKKLISHDMKSNIYNYKFTYSVEIAPICKDSVVLLPPDLARNFGGISRFAIVKRVAKNIVLIDPNTAQVAHVNGLSFFKRPFKELCSTKQLTQFVVMDSEETNVREFAGQGDISGACVVCDVWVQRVSDLGTDRQMFCRTHLGNHLNIGDIVMGYDLGNANMNHEELENLSEDKIPDVLLIKKHFGNKSLRNRQRRWKLRSMGVEDKNSQNRDYMDFLDDLEEDPVLRQNVNVYHNAEKAARADTIAAAQVEETDDPLDPDVPAISVEELLEELTIDPPAPEQELTTNLPAPEQEGEEMHWEDAVETLDPET